MNLLEFKKNIYSQNGEDGIIEHIFNKLKINKGIFCEFGAWDGLHFSNSRFLIEKGWAGVLIESDSKKYRELRSNCKAYKNVVCLNCFVDSSNNSLENIYLRSGLYKDIGKINFLSIDIDGLDYLIFQSISFQPDVVCIEANAGFNPLDDTKLSNEQISKNIGVSLGKLNRIAHKMGYSLVCYTGNAIFIKTSLLKKLGIKELFPVKAYSLFLKSLSAREKTWLYLVNKSIFPPYFKFKNKFLSLQNLKINYYDVASLLFDEILLKFRNITHKSYV